MEYSVINALGNPIRLKLLCCLYDGQKNVQELTDNCGLAQSAISQHLIKLKQSGLVKSQREGKYSYYSLVHPKAAELAKEIGKFIKELET